MGTIKQGILGGFSGKVGSVVGASWKGIAYMRSQADHVKNPRSAAQNYHREAIKVVTNFLKPLAATLRITFGEHAQKMSAFNKAVSVNYHKCLKNVDGHPDIDYEKIVVSQGSLKKFNDATAGDFEMENEMRFITWGDDETVTTYPGMILIIYDCDAKVWHVWQYDQPFTSQEMILLDSDWYSPIFWTSSWALVWDKATGKVSAPIECPILFG